MMAGHQVVHHEDVPNLATRVMHTDPGLHHVDGGNTAFAASQANYKLCCVQQALAPDQERVMPAAIRACNGTPQGYSYLQLPPKTSGQAAPLAGRAPPQV
ncbi:MAG: hypothetical protein KF690_04460 [Bacteroidetes bacterium]|nr:hypothetical protein [Bacteroidota bacterium]